MSDLRDRLARLLCVTTIAVDGWPTGVSFAWSDLQPRSQARWRTIADALLASEEWRTREAAVMEAAGNYADLWRLVHEREDELGPALAEDIIRLGYLRGALFGALARLAETRGEETE